MRARTRGRLDRQRASVLVEAVLAEAVKLSPGLMYLVARHLRWSGRRDLVRLGVADYRGNLLQSGGQNLVEGSDERKCQPRFPESGLAGQRSIAQDSLKRLAEPYYEQRRGSVEKGDAPTAQRSPQTCSFVRFLSSEELEPPQELDQWFASNNEE